MSKIKLTSLIILQAALFVVFLVLTSWLNRFAADDYYFIGELTTKYFQEIYAQLYFQWHGRWTSNFLLLAFLQLRNSPLFIFSYFLFSYGVLFIGIKKLLQQVLGQLQVQISNQQLTLFSIVAMGVLFFCTVNPNETWFWYTSSVVYFWSVIAFFFATSSYLKTKKTVLTYFIYLFSLIYIGGSNEPLTAFTGFLLAYQFIKKKNVLFTVLGLTVLSIAFFINYMSPGTLNRDEITPSLGLIDWVLYLGFGSIKYIFFSSYKTFIPTLFFVIPFYWLGKQSSYKSVAFNIKQQLFYSVIAIGLSVIINQAIVITALGGLSPDRAMISSSIFIAFTLIRFAFLLGVHQVKLPVQSVLIFNVIALLGFNLFFFKIHLSFSKKYDERMLEIIQQNDKKIIKVSPLPFSGYIYNPELKENADYFVNQHLKSGLEINSNIVLKRE